MVALGDYCTSMYPVPSDMPSYELWALVSCASLYIGFSKAVLWGSSAGAFLFLVTTATITATRIMATAAMIIHKMFPRPPVTSADDACGSVVGDMVGDCVGDMVGANDGKFVGAAVGVVVGMAVGFNVGVAVGDAVGAAVGAAVGETVGMAVGFSVGITVGALVGACVGVVGA